MNFFSQSICRITAKQNTTILNNLAMDHFDLFTIVFDILISIIGSLIVNRLIPILKEKFVKAQLWGYDLNKSNSKEKKM